MEGNALAWGVGSLQAVVLVLLPFIGKIALDSHGAILDASQLLVGKQGLTHHCCVSQGPLESCDSEGGWYRGWHPWWDPSLSQAALSTEQPLENQ